MVLESRLQTIAPQDGQVLGRRLRIAGIMAAVALAVCPVLILFLAAQRQIISGMVGSAVKG